jgi:hypothetical protein
MVVVIRRRTAAAVAIVYLLVPTAAIPAMPRTRPRWLPVVRLAVVATYASFIWIRRNDGVYLRKPS